MAISMGTLLLVWVYGYNYGYIAISMGIWLLVCVYGY